MVYTALCFIILLAAAALQYSLRDNRLAKIDGPKGRPFVGIGLSLPPNATRKLREWAQQYGEVYKIRIGWYYWVVLNSPEAIKEVFDRQVCLHNAHNMPAPMGELVVGGMRMLTMPYGPKWRAYRTLVHGLLTPKMVQSFVPVQEFEISQLIYDLANNNFNDAAFYGHIRRTLFSIMMTAVYGRRVDRMDHEDIKYSEQSGKLLGMLGKAGTFIEDELPPLARLPTWLQPSRKKALAHAGWMLWVKMRMWNTLQDQFDLGAAPNCYGADMLKSDYAAQGLKKEDCAWIAGGLVEAGSQTSAATLSNLILYLAATPIAQEKAFQELQRAVGDRAPTYDDIENLPYINACLKEILRLCPAPPWILRHFTDASVVYKDYIIPKGTAIVGNTAAIHFDPVRYPNPFTFNPDRYLNHRKRAAEYAAMADAKSRDHFTFGAGRRICPGSRFAENALIVALANIVWVFEIKPSVVIVDGVDRDAELDFSDAAFDEAPLKSAKPFKARFLPRSEVKLKIVNDRWIHSRN
ncbi:O-methylsterigmatocystin oxidoreductase [Lentithecium fluviatile CBS 122367]|uniref:O-methylsterigmatocystin oxidoreductase n=1 Tax=Lentithecium fluviatile CBS 122367 TaxID=1168545 RepID=A0A6G1JDZ7_9PLEO|nr:O-methylsterigmatocystin oxidoreductase [Lentithecium fluviatile CBS 122367]